MLNLKVRIKDPISGRAIARAVMALALLGGWVAIAAAGSDERKGTAGALELLIPVGVRGTALGSSVVSDANGIESMFWNPAGLSTVTGTEAVFTHTQYFADQKLNYAAVATHMGGFGTLGFDAKVLSIGDIIVTTEQAPDGTGEILNPTFAVLGIGFGRQFTDRVLFGATGHYVNEVIGSSRASGIAFDFGVQYLTGWNGLRFGVVMKNFGPSMEFTGSDFDENLHPPDSDPQASNRTFRSTSAAFEMPSFFTLATSYDLYNKAQQRIVLMGSFQNNNFQFDEVAGAAEWSYRGLYSLRGSYFASFGSKRLENGEDESTKITGGDDLYSGLALGAGAAIRTGDTGKLGVDVSWRPVRDFFDDVVEFGVRFSF